MSKIRNSKTIKKQPSNEVPFPYIAIFPRKVYRARYRTNTRVHTLHIYTHALYTTCIFIIRETACTETWHATNFLWDIIVEVTRMHQGCVFNMWTCESFVWMENKRHRIHYTMCLCACTHSVHRFLAIHRTDPPPSATPSPSPILVCTRCKWYGSNFRSNSVFIILLRSEMRTNRV